MGALIDETDGGLLDDLCSEAPADTPGTMPTEAELEELYRLYRTRLTAAIEDNSAAATHKEAKAALAAADMAIINYVGDMQRASRDPQQRMDFTEAPAGQPDDASENGEVRAG